MAKKELKERFVLNLKLKTEKFMLSYTNWLHMYRILKMKNEEYKDSWIEVNEALILIILMKMV